MRLFDAHNHVQNYAAEAELDAAMRAAAGAGVAGMICCGTGPDDWARVMELSVRYPVLTPAFGLHPWFTAEEGWAEKLQEFVRRVPCCVGEIGLDGIKDVPGQEERFAEQLALAARFGRPAVIHCVKSWDRLGALLKKNAPPAFMLHAYGGSPDMVPQFAGLGGYFSFGWEIKNPKREKLRAALAAVPADRLLLETESPEGNAPGWRSGPAGVADVAAAAAGILGRPAEDVAELALANAGTFLKNIKI
jgi:TatD DNase family protein